MVPPLHSEPPASARGHRSDILFTVAILGLIVLCWEIRDVLLLIYVSALFAVVLSPLINVIRRIHIGHWWPGRGFAILVIITATFASLITFVVFALPPIFRDLQQAAAELPHRVSVLHSRLHDIPVLKDIDAAAFEQHITGAIGGVVGLFTGLAGVLVAFFSWLIITAYFILDGERTFYWFLSFFAEPQRGRLRATMMRAKNRIQHWLAGQAALMVILGLCSGITFALLHVRYAAVLGVISGLFNIVPFAGPFTAFVISSAVAASDSWTKMLGVMAFYAIYQQIENGFLIPRVMKYSVDLPALAVIVALILGGAIAGMIGALIAVPTAAVIAVLLDEYFVRHRPHSLLHEHGQHAEAAAASDLD